jgi:isopenicillin N synthase-like dioxygenase
MSDTIPIISVGGFPAGRPGARDALAREIHDALTGIGFFLLIDHDVPAELIARTFAEAARFHAQPLAAKLALRFNEHNNGYMVMGRYAVQTTEFNNNDKGDLHEAFLIKRERAANDPLLLSGQRFVGPNVWPDERDLPGFRAHMLSYCATLDRFGRRMLPAVATALDLSPGWFDDAFIDSQFTLRLSHYPPVEAEPNQFGIAPHTDSNFMTFLPQSGVPGLQLLLPSREWIDVPYIPGSFAVNSGDMLYRWSNGRFKSTPHRVLPPKSQDRYAIPFFLGPNFDQLIECLPSCTGSGNPPRWEPIRYGDWTTYWNDANYDRKLQQDVA